MKCEIEPKNAPSKRDAIARKRGEVSALGRLIRKFDELGIAGDAMHVARQQYSKAQSLLKQAHETMSGPAEALENCRLFAARHRSEEWAKTILRFCADGGSIGSPFREPAPARDGGVAQRGDGQ